MSSNIYQIHNPETPVELDQSHNPETPAEFDQIYCTLKTSAESNQTYNPETPANPTMTEPRARAARHKGQLNFEAELRGLLYAYGDDAQPLPETVRVLDEIVTDFIIEMCHQASRSAAYSHRQKVKVDDFKFAIRGNEAMLGRVQELLGMDKELREARKQFDFPESKAGLEKGKGGKEGKGRGRGRPRGSGREGKEGLVEREEKEEAEAEEEEEEEE